MELLTETRKLGPAWAQVEAYWVQPPPAAKPAPGILILHTIRGVTDHERTLARAFAQLGFVAVVPDLYSHQKMRIPAEDAKELEELLRKVPFDGSYVRGFEAALRGRSRQDQERLRRAARVAVNAPDPNAVSDLKICVSALCATPGVDAKRVACLGMSMGGGYAWTLATLEPRVRATVVAYGRPVLPYDQLEQLKGSVLAIHAGEDTRLTDLLPEVEEEMAARGRSFTHITYPGVHHGFLNHQVSAYDEACAHDALLRALGFLQESFGSLPPEAVKALKAGALPGDAIPPRQVPPGVVETPPPVPPVPEPLPAPTPEMPVEPEVAPEAPPEPDATPLAPAAILEPEGTAEPETAEAPTADPSEEEEMAEEDESAEEEEEAVEEGGGSPSEETVASEPGEPAEGAGEEEPPPALEEEGPLPRSPAEAASEEDDEEVTEADVEVLLKQGPIPPSRSPRASERSTPKPAPTKARSAPPSRPAPPPSRGKSAPAPKAKGRSPPPPAKRPPPPPSKPAAKPAARSTPKPPPPKGKDRSREKESDRKRKGK